MTAGMEEIKLDWSSAEVDGGELTVALEGEVSEQWQEHFERTVRLLGSADWEQVELEDPGVRVHGVTAGQEDKLRHYLEGVVDQANAAVAAQEEAEREDSDGEDGRDGEDAQMTERFRSFAERGEEPS